VNEFLRFGLEAMAGLHTPPTLCPLPRFGGAFSSAFQECEFPNGTFRLKPNVIERSAAERVIGPDP
jgi:hypothetical protein